MKFHLPILILLAGCATKIPVESKPLPQRSPVPKSKTMQWNYGDNPDNFRIYSTDTLILPVKEWKTMMIPGDVRSLPLPPGGLQQFYQVTAWKDGLESDWATTE